MVLLIAICLICLIAISSVYKINTPLVKIKLKFRNYPSILVSKKIYEGGINEYMDVGTSMLESGNKIVFYYSNLTDSTCS